MHVDVFGSGEPVLLLHGCPNPPAHLEPLARALEDRFQVLLAHLPGYGRSASPTAPPTVRLVLDELVEELRGRGIRRLAVVGYSLGGYMALALSVDSRLEVTRVVGLAPFAYYTPEEKAQFPLLAAAVRAGADLADIVQAIVLSPEYAKAHPDLTTEVRSWSRACSVEHLLRQADALTETEDLIPRLEGSPLRVVVRIGALDTAVPRAKVDRTVAAMPNSELQIIPGVSHVLLIEDREATIAAVRKALTAA
jgi:pimeloyl-ACP methyl ester carboxylesterase